MKSIPQVITLNGEGISRFEQTFYDAAVIYNDGSGYLSELTAIPILPNTTEISIEIFLYTFKQLIRSRRTIKYGH